MLTKLRPIHADAGAPQPAGMPRFSWSGFCKTDMVQLHAFIPEHVCQAVGAYPEHNWCPANSSRRLQWRNSLSCLRSWCRLSRPPVRARPLNRSIISNPCMRRSMSSQARPKVNIAKFGAGQSLRTAPFFRTCLDLHRSGLLKPVRFSLWPSCPPCASLGNLRRVIARPSTMPRRCATADVSGLTPERRSRCPNLHSRWSSARPSPLRPARVQPLHRSPSWPPRSWSSLKASRASAELTCDRAEMPVTALQIAAFGRRGHAC